MSAGTLKALMQQESNPQKKKTKKTKAAKNDALYL